MNMSPHGADGNLSRACDSEEGHTAVAGGGAEIVLFGVRVKVDPMRKCVSLNDLSRYELPPAPPHAAAAAGYTSADDAIQHRVPGNSERKRGIPWTEDEHKLFLLGLQKVGKGDWRGISRNFVKTRTPTQVASHAQKYFLRRSNLSKRRRRSSLFDITAESVAAVTMEEENANEFLQSPKETPVLIGSQMLPMPVSVPDQIENPIPTLALKQIDHVNHESYSTSLLVQPNPFTSRTSDLNSMATNHHPLSLDLSLSSTQNHMPRYSSSIQMRANLNNGESIISVA